MAPLFITRNSQLQANWLEAFPQARLAVGLPEKFDMFSREPIFVDFMGLSAAERKRWLNCAVSTRRSVIVLTPIPSDHEALQVIKAGAVGYGHSFAVSEILKQMLSVSKQGGLWLGGSLMRRVLSSMEQVRAARDLEPQVKLSEQPVAAGGGASRQLAGQAEPQSEVSKCATSLSIKSSFPDLSEREVEVALLVARGATNQEISASLDVKERTIKAHITSMFKKLSVRNRVELALKLHNISISSPS